MKTVTVKKAGGTRQFSVANDDEVFENLKYILPRTRPGDTVTIYHERPPEPAMSMEEAVVAEAPKPVEIKEPVKVESEPVSADEEQPRRVAKVSRKRRKAKPKRK